MIRGIILGMGKIAQTGHMPAYHSAALEQSISIAAAVEPNLQSRAIALQQFPQLKFYDTLEQALNHEQADFVDICTPPHTHSAFIAQLLSHQQNILCEKPFAIDEPSARMLAALLKSRSDVIFMGCHQYRFSPVWKQFYDFKKTFSEHDRFVLQFDVYRTEADPGLKIGSEVWRTDKKISGGGILADTGVHYLYLCYWLFGKPLAITARTQTLLYTNSSIEDTANVVLEYPSGVAQINLTWAADRRSNSARFMTRKKSLQYDGTSLVRFTNDASEALQVPSASDKSTYITMYADLFQEFAQQVEQKKQRQDWIDEAYESVRMLQTSYESAARGTTIMVK
ncbi:MAG TPA: Gfo/Idh/MocA family oxidoreductase [Bacteroidota bacterium]|nr:Gfo/Idh/MocA family oxidoreductase [Bacteroidota bacterium]